MIENSTLGLTMLDGDRKVVVTGEEHHQNTLWAYAPREGRARQVAVELVPAGPQRRLEARLDGQQVGELTALMSQRYGPIVDAVISHGGRVGCLGLVVAGKRGIEVELRLPTVGPGRPLPGSAPTGRLPLGGAPTYGQPGSPALPRPPGPGVPPTRRRSRKPLWVGIGVAALLVLIITLGSTREPAPTATTSAPTPVATAGADPTTATATTALTTTAAAPGTGGTVPSAAPPAVPAPRRTAAAPRPSPASVPQTAVDVPEQAKPAPSAAFYKNCTEAKKAGVAPLHRGDPGYRAALDRDSDGVACE